jgi:hypothetical protein
MKKLKVLITAAIVGNTMFYAVPCSAQDTTARNYLSLATALQYTVVTDTVLYERIIWADSLGLKMNKGYVIQTRKVPPVNYLYGERKILKVALLNGREIRPEELVELVQKVNNAWEWH